MRARDVLIVAFALVVAGCMDEYRYLTPEAGGPFAFAITADTPPVFTSRDGDLFIVEERIETPFRQPTAEELGELGNLDGRQLPYPRLPWLERGDFELRIDYTVSNLDTERPVDLAVTVNGFNEFHEYVPGVRIVENMLVADYSGWERTLRLDPGERRSGTVREEELDEVAVDLATMVNGAPNTNQIVHPDSHSALDPRSQQYIPEVIPALTGMRVGIRAITRSGGAPPAVVMELSVRVRDVRGVLVQGEDEPWTAPTPALVSPMDLAPADD